MILRTTFTDGQVVFEDLSDKFILTSKQRCPEKFDALLLEHFGPPKEHHNNFSQDCYAFISSLRLSRFDIPIFKDYHYAVLSERGCEIMRVGIGDL